MIPERTTYKLYDIVADQKLYSVPNNMVKILGVYRKWSYSSSTSTFVYIQIPRVVNLDITQPMSATAADAETDIIIV